MLKRRQIEQIFQRVSVFLYSTLLVVMILVLVLVLLATLPFEGKEYYRQYTHIPQPEIEPAETQLAIS